MYRSRFGSRVLIVLGFSVAAGCASSENTTDEVVQDDSGGGRPVSDTGDSGQSDGAGDDADVDVPSDVDVADADPLDAPLPDSDTDDIATPDTTVTDTAGPDAADVSLPDALPEGCDEKLRFIYVIDKTKQLHRFDPVSGEFTRIGEVDCGEFSDTTPSSMAMSTLGFALVNYSDNSLQAVDIDDAGCSESAWVPGTGGFERFGMGYVADTRGGTETLYISNADTLATLNTDTWRVTAIGDLPSQSELSGTGNGELWGFFPLESPPQLLQLDRTDASVLTSYNLPPLPPNLDTFAFTAWGGEFYIFYRLSGLGESTTVYRFDRRTETLEQVVAEAGINVVGAGVSICAPTTR